MNVWSEYNIPKGLSRAFYLKWHSKWRGFGRLCFGCAGGYVGVLAFLAPLNVPGWGWLVGVFSLGALAMAGLGIDAFRHAAAHKKVLMGEWGW